MIFPSSFRKERKKSNKIIIINLNPNVWVIELETNKKWNKWPNSIHQVQDELSFKNCYKMRDYCITSNVP